MNLAMHTLKALKRRFLHVSGSDAERFLNGMFTADMKAAERHLPLNVTGQTLLLGVKGKVVCSAQFLCLEKNSYLFSIDENYYSDCVQVLEKLLVADDVILNESDEFDQVFVSLQSPFNPVEEQNLRVKNLVPKSKDKLYFSQTEDWGLRIPRQTMGPRHEELWIKKGKQLPFAPQLMSTTEWNLARIRHGVPELGVDFTQESLPLEFPLEESISFHKGCYIGQEVVARATYRGQMVKSWVRVEGEALLEENAFLFSTEDPERPIGKLTTCVEEKALGLLRNTLLQNPESLFQRKSDGTKIRILKVENLAAEYRDT